MGNGIRFQAWISFLRKIEQKYKHQHTGHNIYCTWPVKKTCCSSQLKTGWYCLVEPRMLKFRNKTLRKKDYVKKKKKKKRIRVVPKRKVFQPLFVQGAISQDNSMRCWLSPSVYMFLYTSEWFFSVDSWLFSCKTALYVQLHSVSHF